MITFLDNFLLSCVTALDNHQLEEWYYFMKIITSINIISIFVINLDSPDDEATCLENVSDKVFQK